MCFIWIHSRLLNEVTKDKFIFHLRFFFIVNANCILNVIKCLLYNSTIQVSFKACRTYYTLARSHETIFKRTLHMGKEEKKTRPLYTFSLSLSLSLYLVPIKQLAVSQFTCARTFSTKWPFLLLCPERRKTLVN